MKILVGLSNGMLEENTPYKMFIIDVDSIEGTKQEWQDLNIVEISKCVNVRVNLGNYNPLKNPAEYLEAEFDVSRIVDRGINQSDFQITNVYTNELGKPELFRTVNSLGEIEMHAISELEYKKNFSIYGSVIENLPSFVKKESLNKAYDWWRKKDEASKLPKNRFAFMRFDTYGEMPVKLLYHYLIGVKKFQLGFHTATEMIDKDTNEVKHEYFLFKDTANIKLTESVSKNGVITIGKVGIYGNKDPYPDKLKLEYYGATMSLICDRKNYPTFDWNETPISEVNYDKDGVAVTIEGTNGLFAIYNKLEEANCISNFWRLGEYNNFYGVTLSSLLPNKLDVLSKKLQNEKEKNDYGHWSSYNTHDWMQTMALALSIQYYSSDLRKIMGSILQNYKTIFSKKLEDMIEKIGVKDSLEVLKWSKINAEDSLQNISLIKEDGTNQKLKITLEQIKSLFTFKRNNYDLPDWLQIYSPETIEKLGGEEYLIEIINARGENSAKAFLAIWAEKIESDKRYASHEKKEKSIHPIEILSEEPDSLDREQKKKKEA